MTDTTSNGTGGRYVGVHTTDAARRRLRRRYAAEARFRIYGIVAILFGLGMLTTLIVTIASTGLTGFVQTRITLDVHLSAEAIDPNRTGDPQIIRRARFQDMAEDGFVALLPGYDPETDRRAARALLSVGAGVVLRDMVLADPSVIGQTVRITVPLASAADQAIKGNTPRDVPENRRRISDQQYAWLDALQAAGHVTQGFNWSLFTSPDSRQPELAGLWGAIKGSAFALAVCLALAFPIGIGAAVYLEEFAPKNRLTDLIEVNINNLAAVPSIIFGLLGLAVLIQTFGLPRSAPLVGGIVLALMTLPTIIIAARASLKAVPPSIREAALGVGASRLQTIFHHVLPLALPGMLTGTIIGMAQALGETAPLLMIGMNAFVGEAPQSLTSPSAALPSQIYLWAGSSERGFVERTSAAILVLLGFLVIMNSVAVYLRKRFERRW